MTEGYFYRFFSHRLRKSKELAGYQLDLPMVFTSSVESTKAESGRATFCEGGGEESICSGLRRSRGEIHSRTGC